VPLNGLKERLKYDTTRPLLLRPANDNAMKELVEKRIPIYKKAADVAVDGNKSPLQVALSIINITKN
jgi:shikimate kinase